jgi:hypothetical protein
MPYDFDFETSALSMVEVYDLAPLPDFDLFAALRTLLLF